MGSEEHACEMSWQEITTYIKEGDFEILKVQGIGLVPGTWELQNLVPIRQLHLLNIHLPEILKPIISRIDEIASLTFIVAQKPNR